MTEFGKDVSVEMLPGAEAYGTDFAALMKRIHDARMTYANTCFGDIVCGLSKKVLDPGLNDALDVAKATGKLKDTLAPCGRVACESALEIVTDGESEPVSAYVQPCAKHADGIYVSDLEHGPERPPISPAPNLPEEA